jgi:uncharacterized protein YjaZ
MDSNQAGFDPRKDYDIYSANEDLRNYSDSDQQYDMKPSKTPFEKKQKKIEKKIKKQNKQLLIMMPFLMYAGAGRQMLTYDKKRKIIKIS